MIKKADTVRIQCPKCGTEVATITTENTNKGENTMKRTFKGEETMKVTGETTFTVDQIRELMQAMIKEEVNREREAYNAEVAEKEEVVDGGLWAKTSALYGKKICGQVFNPFLFRGKLAAQFIEIMKEFDCNVDEGIRCKYTYMDGIKHLIEQCKILALLDKKNDFLAYKEREKFWSVRDCKEIFDDYFAKVRQYIIREGMSKMEKDNSEVAYINVGRYGRPVKVSLVRSIEGNKVVETYVIDEETEALIITKRKEVARSYTYRELYSVMSSFKLFVLPADRTVDYVVNELTGKWKKRYTRCYDGFKHHPAFFEGFKKAGAYYTLKNEIAFNNRVFKGRTGSNALALLRSFLDDNTEAYKLYAMVKEMFGLL